jgi:glycosyltransferase involved in cell wall biosynthesis
MTTFSEITEPGRRVRFYEDGILAKTKHFEHDGRLVRIDHHDRARRVTHREYFDPRGMLVRVDDVNPEIGKPTLRRWFERSGACWLTNWLNNAGDATATVRHTPVPVAYDDFGHCVAQWVDEVLADAEAPVVFSDKRILDPVLLAMTHPQARKVAVLHSCHTRRPYRPMDATRANWRQLFSHLKTFDRVVTLSSRQRDDIAQRFGGTNLVAINVPTPPLADSAVTREPGLLVAVARLGTEKRLDHAIRAFAIASKEVSGARFDIYGSGAELGRLKSLTDELGISDRVRFGGFTDRPLEIFAGAEAMVLTSWYEGWGLVLNEAMGVGTPVVAYDINYGPADVIRHEVDGLLVPSGEIDKLAAAMVRLLGAPDYARQLGERAREVSERFSAQRWEREWTELFDRVVSGSTAAGEHEQTGAAGTSAVAGTP